MRLLVTRPEPDASAQGRALEALGMTAIIEPLLEIEFLEAGPLSLEGVQGLIATSRNGLRALEAMAGLEVMAHVPVLAVGPASAQMARALGFRDVHEGPGTAAGLVDVVDAHCSPDRGPLVHLAGSNLAADLKGSLEALGFTVAQPVLYRARPRAALSGPVLAALRAGEIGGVVLMSPRTAKIFCELIDESGVREAAGEMIYFCLSDGVARRLEGRAGLQIRVSKRPREDDMLALIAGEEAH